MKTYKKSSKISLQHISSDHIVCLDYILNILSRDTYNDCI